MTRIREKAFSAALAMAALSTNSFGAVTTTGAISPGINGIHIIIGYLANGTLQINSGSVLTQSNDAYIGGGDGVSIFPTASATVTGPGSTWNPNQLTIGYFSTSSLSILNGGTVYTTRGASISQSSSALVDGTNSTWNFTSSTFDNSVAIDGSVTVRNGGAFTGPAALLNNGGTVLVSGSGSTFNATLDLFIGSTSAAAMTVQNGAHLLSGDAFAGTSLGSNGQLTLTGASTHWDNSSTINLGSDGNATLSILAGATVLTSQVQLSGDHGFASLLVDGPGSRLDISTDLYFYGDLANVQITNGAVVTAGGSTNPGGVNVNLPSGRLSTFLVDNATHSTGSLAVAKFASATLTIQNHGNLAVAGDASVAPSSVRTTGSILVDGSGSTLTSATMSVGRTGNGGQGALTVKNGAFVSTGQLLIGGNGLVNLRDGIITAPTISGGGSLTGTGLITGNVGNIGFLGIGNSVGSLAITGSFSQDANGHIQVEIASDSSLDQLNVTGSATLSGTIDFIFLYTPVGPHTYTFLNSPAITATANFTATGFDPAAVSTDFAHGSFTVNAPEPATLAPLAASSPLKNS